MGPSMYGPALAKPFISQVFKESKPFFWDVLRLDMVLKVTIVQVLFVGVSVFDW